MSINEIDYSSCFAQERAKKENLDIVVPTANQLQVDIDSPEQFQQFQRMIWKLRNNGIVDTWETHPSKSGGGRLHITVNLTEELSIPRRIALQSILGSDPHRELFAYLRLVDGDPIPILFFESKKEQ